MLDYILSLLKVTKVNFVIISQKGADRKRPDLGQFWAYFALFGALNDPK